ncbi:MAG: glycosyltransferase family 39 protein [Gemmatimonadales bacterium]
MMLGFVASLVASALIGLLSIGCAGWRSAGLWRSRLLIGFLAVGIGLGLSSSLFFVWLSLAGAPSALFPLLELAWLLLLASGALYASKMRRTRTGSPGPGASATAPRMHPLLALTLGLCVGCATIAFLVESATSRQGGWDAWMTWNMHARAIFRGGDHWREVVTGLPAWSHPDYPLLVPGSVARIWTYMGQETALAPASVAMLFTFATVGLLYSSVSILRSRTQGTLAALLLLGTKFFILHGASQYADIPLSFFFLATLVLLALPEVWPDDRPRLLVLAGVTAGLAAWTKNEGFLFLLVVLVGYGLVTVRARGWHAWLSDTCAVLIGLAPVLVMIVCFKIWLAPPNDLMLDQGFRQTADRLLDGGRYLQLLAGFTQGFLEIGAQGLVGLLLLTYVLCAGPAPAGPARLGAKTAAIVLALVLAGYVAVLLTAPAPLLATNIRSINRLLLQLWPSILFAYFLSVRTAEEAGVVGRRLSHV